MQQQKKFTDRNYLFGSLIFVFIVLVPLAVIIYAALDVPEDIVMDNSIQNFEYMMFAVYLLLGFLFLFGFFNQIILKSDHCVLRHSYIHRIFIPASDIIGVGVSELPARKHMPIFGFNSPPWAHVSGWLGYVSTFKSRGVIIQTAKTNYMISCAQADEAAQAIREQYRVGDFSGELPPRIR